MIEINLTTQELRELIHRNENSAVIELALELIHEKHSMYKFESTDDFINQADEEDLLALFDKL